MEFKNKIQNYLSKKIDILIQQVEQEGDNESIVLHIAKEDNAKIEAIKDEMEKELDVAVVQSDMYEMNVVIVESNQLEG